MVVTNDKELYLKAKEYSDHGHESNPNLPRSEDTRRMAGFNYNMMELQGAIGLAQLKKLDYGMAKQKENKKKIKEAIIKNITGIRFREMADSGGEIGDTLVFFVEDSNEAKNFAKMLTDKGLGTKNIPSAISWHFAGTWDHMLSQYDKYKGKDLMDLWGKSYEILSRAIAIPIMIKMTEEQIRKVVETITKIFKEI